MVIDGVTVAEQEFWITEQTLTPHTSTLFMATASHSGMKGWQGWWLCPYRPPLMTPPRLDHGALKHPLNRYCAAQKVHVCLALGGI